MDGRMFMDGWIHILARPRLVGKEENDRRLERRHLRAFTLSLSPRYDRRKGGKRGRPVSERGRPDGDAERFAAVELEREVDEPCRPRTP
jgi:hypothetical protein